MDLRFTNENVSFETELPAEIGDAMEAEFDVFADAGARPWPEDEDSDWDCVVDAARLRESFTRLRTQLRHGAAGGAFIYMARCRIPSSPGVSEGAGGFSGFRIAGEIHSLWLGYERCLLKRMAVKPDGTGEVVERQDVRHLEHIDTDDWGRIEIYKRNAANQAVAWISRVLRKLKNLEGDVVVEFA